MLIPVISIGALDFRMYIQPAETVVSPPPEIGDLLELDVMISGLGGEGEEIYSLAFAIDYDVNIIKIEDPRFAGDINEHFEDFGTNTSPDSMLVDHYASTTLDSDPDPVFDGREVERYTFGAVVKDYPGQEHLESPFKLPDSSP
jgi:hypothetical protein